MALDSARWQRLPISGIEFGRLATIANLWRSPPIFGGRCQELATDSGEKKSVARLWRPSPRIEILCRKATGAAAL
jgi:hypothetical protein